MLRQIAHFKLAIICCLFLAVAACSKKATNNLEAGMGAAPGTEQEFTTVVGDRVFFLEEDLAAYRRHMRVMRDLAARPAVAMLDGLEKHDQEIRDTHGGGILAGWEMSRWQFLLVVNLILLVLGCLMEGSTILLVVVPVLVPTAQALGVDMVHFGVMVVVNIMIGLVTPPYGLLLFLMVKIGEVSLAALVREVLPFLWVMIGALALMTFIPEIVLFLPRLFGYKG